MGNTMSTANKVVDIRKEFPGDEALQQVHLARRALQDAAKRKGLTLGEYVRSLKIPRVICPLPLPNSARWAFAPFAS